MHSGGTNSNICIAEIEKGVAGAANEKLPSRTGAVGAEAAAGAGAGAAWTRCLSLIAKRRLVEH